MGKSLVSCFLTHSVFPEICSRTDRQADSTLLPIERRNKYLQMKSDINSYDKQQLTRDYQQQAAAAVRISSSCRTARWKHTVYKW